MEGIIYEYRNNLNGMVYIGQSIDFMGRKRSHRWLSLNGDENSYIHRAMRKYGEENFTISVVECCEVDKLDDREIYWINERKCMSPDGYNLSTGGNRPIMSEESRQKMSNARKGMVFTDEHRKNLSLSHMGKSPTLEQREKQREKMTGRVIPPDQLEKIRNHAISRRTPVARWSAGGKLMEVYESVKMAGKKLDIHMGHVVECIRGRRKCRKQLGDDFLTYYTET